MEEASAPSLSTPKKWWSGGWGGLYSLKEDSVLGMEPDSFKQPPQCPSVLGTFDILIFGKRSFKTPPPDAPRLEKGKAPRRGLHVSRPAPHACGRSRSLDLGESSPPSTWPRIQRPRCPPPPNDTDCSCPGPQWREGGLYLLSQAGRGYSPRS